MSDIRSIFSPRIRVSVPVSKLPSRTKRSPDHVRASDINFIVARYKKTGELPVSKRAPMFSDMSAPDYKEALDLLTAAQASFDILPAQVRAKFNNDPTVLLSALDKASDPQVHQYLFDAGILASPPEALPQSEPKVAKSSAKPTSKKAAVQPDIPFPETE